MSLAWMVPILDPGRAAERQKTVRLEMKRREQWQLSAD